MVSKDNTREHIRRDTKSFLQGHRKSQPIPEGKERQAPSRTSQPSWVMGAPGESPGASGLKTRWMK